MRAFDIRVRLRPLPEGVALPGSNSPAVPDRIPFRITISDAVCIGWRHFVDGGGQWNLFLPVGLAFGIGLYFSFPLEPAIWWGWMAVILASCLAIATRSRPAVPLVLIGLLAAVGFSSAQLRVTKLETQMLDRTGWATVTGSVAQVEARPRDYRISLSEISLSDTRLRVTPTGVRLVARGLERPPEIGSRIRVRARIGPPSPPIAPGGFDFQRHAYFQGIGAVGFAVGAFEVLSVRAKHGWQSTVDRTRAAISARVRSALGPELGPIAAALLTGDRAGIPEAALESLRRTGLAHLLAISGLHMALVVGTVLFGIRFGLAAIPGVALRWPIKKLAAGLALVAAAGYLLLAGAPIPTQRAFVMVGLVLVGVLLDREALSLRTVALAAAVVLLLFPESLLGPSFQMSFAAVTALIAAYEGLRWRKDRHGTRGEPSVRLLPAWVGRGLRYVGGVALTSLIASAATAPIAAYHFQMIPVAGTIANLIAVPATALMTMPAGVLALLLMPFGLDTPALEIMGWGISITLWSARIAEAFPFAVTSIAAVPTWSIVVLVLGGLWTVIWRGMFRWFGFLAAVAALVGWTGAAAPSVLISADADVVGVRFAEGDWAVSTNRRAAFVRAGWQRRWGGDVEVDFSQAEADTSRASLAEPAWSRLRCDGMGCVHGIGNRRVAILTTPEATAEDCARAAVVIVTAPVRTPCPGPSVVIDRNDIKRSGAHAIWIEDGDIRVETVAGRRGTRPWSGGRVSNIMDLVDSR